MTQHILPELATTADLKLAVEQITHALTLRVLTIVCAVNGLVLAIIKLT
jgi:hypothetical protein